MLIRFNVKNFLSFAEREDGRTEEFSMLAGKVQKKLIKTLLYLMVDTILFQLTQLMLLYL